jgi:CRISPR/Cas system CSM-associated protein Csm2 small subunit
MSKQFQNFIKLSAEKAIQLYMEVVNDTLSIEYTETKDIKSTSTSIFKVYYDLNMSNGRDHTAIRFYETFEKIMSE